jgi:hypothetical protein
MSKRKPDNEITPGALRKRKFDEKVRTQKQEEAEAALYYAEQRDLRAQLKDEREEQARIRSKYCFFSETSPRVPATTHAEELAVHREWLRAIHQELKTEFMDVQPGESLRDVARRTWEAWATLPGSVRGVKGYLHGFRRAQQAFDHDNGFIVNDSDFEEWKPPADCTGDEPIDVATLPEITPDPRVPRYLSEPGKSIPAFDWDLSNPARGEIEDLWRKHCIKWSINPAVHQQELERVRSLISKLAAQGEV